MTTYQPGQPVLYIGKSKLLQRESWKFNCVSTVNQNGVWLEIYPEDDLMARVVINSVDITADPEGARYDPR